MPIPFAKNLKALRALPSSRFVLHPDVQLLGHGVAGDGGCGTFSWNESETQADNDDTVIKPDDVPADSPGRLVRLFTGPLRELPAAAICIRLDPATQDCPDEAIDLHFVERTGFWSR